MHLRIMKLQSIKHVTELSQHFTCFAIATRGKKNTTCFRSSNCSSQRSISSHRDMGLSRGKPVRSYAYTCALFSPVNRRCVTRSANAQQSAQSNPVNANKDTHAHTLTSAACQVAKSWHPLMRRPKRRLAWMDALLVKT